MIFQKQKERSDESFVEKLKLLGSSRIFIALTLLIATLIIHPGKENPALYYAFLFVTICHVSVAVFFFFFEWVLNEKYLFRFTFMQIAWDILFHTSIVYLTGGINSQYKFLYWISIFFASILFLRIGAIVAAALSALFYAILIDLEYFQNIPQLVQSFSHFKFSTEKGVVDSILLNTLVFAFIGFISSIITTRLYNAELLAVEQEKRVRDLEDKVMKSKHLASVGEMAARIAHEIRNPLTSVSASMEMLSKREEQGSNEGMIINIAKREAKRLNQLLTDFLDYARPSQPHIETGYLTKFIRESIQLFQQGYPDVTVRFESNIPEEKPLKLDARMVTQLFWNILKNAAESMDNKGRIEVVFSQESNRWYVIEVRDEGIGFDMKDQEKIFEPFYSSKPKGTGLGLSIAYRVMQDHHGTIELEPRKEKGSLCRLTFPIEVKETKHG